MEQMILSKNNKHTNKKQKHSMTKKSRLGVPERGGKGREREGWVFWVFLGMQTVTFGVDGQWDPIVQHREMCVIGSLCCTIELDETL